MPSLSVCMHVRNEEKNLPRALASIKGLAGEIIVLDTGSTDRTVEIALEHGAKVHHFPWCDDFAAARNAAIQHATCDWIFLLDADEALLPESQRLARQAMDNADALGWLVMLQDMATEAASGEFTLGWRLRLFRNHRELRFRGRLHADFDPPLERTAESLGMKVLPSRITIRHWGYIRPEDRQRKLQRAAPLLRLELEERPGQLYYMVELFRTLKEMGEHQQASEALLEAMRVCAAHVHEPTPPIGYAALLLETVLQLPGEGMPQPWTPELARELAERWFPRSPPLLWLTAQQDFMAQRFDAAERKLRRLIEMGRTHAYDMTCNFDPRIIGDDARLNLAVCLVRQGMLNEAEALLVEMSRGGSHVEQAMANLKVVRQLKREHGSPRKTLRRKRK